MELIPKLYLSIALAFLILSLIALPFLRPGSPSFIVDILGIVLLVLFVIILIIFIHRKLLR